MVKIQKAGFMAGLVKPSDTANSDSHWHHDVAVLVVLALRRPQLAGRLRILQFEFHVSRAAFRKSSTYCALNPMVSASPL